MPIPVPPGTSSLRRFSSSRDLSTPLSFLFISWFSSSTDAEPGIEFSPSFCVNVTEASSQTNPSKKGKASRQESKLGYHGGQAVVSSGGCGCKQALGPGAWFAKMKSSGRAPSKL
ncbi:hypothetical protein Nepgr_025433 [Nepenthes gracilis]|uniref:Uncharacterized protein n=1 Tax=Nepenthes gracilis TaxID=150966 RepID=A0AAD3T5W7_NEPGR|nr:hypothetical protein Nepgr_025433 [Nepenthes gracilis]